MPEQLSFAKNIIVITGPTGSGKTDLSIKIAEHFGCPVISADSRQMYRGMAIGTAQPNAEQLAAVKHYFINSHDPGDEFTAGRYEREALQLLDELFVTHDTLVVVGGSGLYIDALCRGMDEIPDADPDIRHKLNERLKVEGLHKLSCELQELDPEYASRADLNNPQRVIRALEVCIATGQTFSSYRKGQQRQRAFGIIKTATILPRATLYERIDRRVDEMVSAGLLDEARTLYPLRHLNALQTVGYKELFDHFDGNIGFDEAIELIKRNSRRYAKRQLTWFGRDSSIKWFSPFASKQVIDHAELSIAGIYKN